MAVLKMYSLKDVKVGAFNRPMFVQNRAVVERAVGDAMADPNQMLSVHPEDYQLWYLGEFDDVSGNVTPVAPEFMCNVVDLKGDQS